MAGERKHAAKNCGATYRVRPSFARYGVPNERKQNRSPKTNTNAFINSTTFRLTENPVNGLQKLLFHNADRQQKTAAEISGFVLNSVLSRAIFRRLQYVTI